MKKIKLRKNSLSELKSELLNLLREKFNLRVQFLSGKLKKLHVLKFIRRKIARVRTIISIQEKEIE
ncbi:50S ribosomal protein L29 [Buchnera aphidicola]|uniref:50S ribosomal protein L29 n=1 Tax=Buchnera aphidicola TaxID=9 RepID=UPI0031B8A760